jgi:hypothetical protein
MPVGSLQEAQFDHVDEDGELVFRARGLKFRVAVNDEFEHAILEARQILSETGETENPGTAKTLPISSIQALIRAGAQPDKVAEKYGLSQALVRRFAAPVETEKQYAIKQFLSVSAPKGSKVRSVEELIARTLAAARIGMESVTWSATRRGREPWQISAVFSTQRNQVRAEWAWNMHDNTVECQNSVAQILLGEVKTDQTSPRNDTSDSSDEAGHASSNQAQKHHEDNMKAAAQPNSASSNDATSTQLGANNRLPGDSLRSARIANTVASLLEQPQNNQPTGSMENRNNTSISPQEKSEANEFVSLPYAVPKAQLAQPASDITATSKPATPADAFSLPLPQRESAVSNEVSKPPISNDTRKESVDVEKQADSSSSSEKSEQKQSKRKSGRSAIPSWDEILFGE